MKNSWIFLIDDSYRMESNNDQCLEISEKGKTLSDKKIKQLVLEKYNIELALLNNGQAKTQMEILKYLRKPEGSSLKQLSRLTGFTVNKIFKV